MLQQIKETADFLLAKISSRPETGIILGTGLGNLVTQITEKTEIPYDQIPNFPVSTVEGHSGKLIFGKLGNTDVLAMQGRFHYYEGYDMKSVTFPVRVMHAMGIKTLLVSNASGGVHPDFVHGWCAGEVVPGVLSGDLHGDFAFRRGVVDVDADVVQPVSQAGRRCETWTALSGSRTSF